MFKFRSLLILITALTASLLSGCFNNEPTDSLDGEELYSYYCKQCHKKDGSGDPIAGFPANKRTQLLEEQVILLIRKGDPARPAMPVFPQLSEEQAAAVVDYLFSLKGQ